MDSNTLLLAILLVAVLVAIGLLILLMLVDVDLQEEDRRLPPGYRLRHPAQLGRVLQRLFMSMNVLHETFDVPEAHNEAMTAAVIAALGLVG